MLAVLSAAGCTKLKPNGYPPREDAPSSDTPFADASRPDTSAMRPCGHAQPPPPPAVPDVPGSLELILASRNIDYGDRPNSRNGRPRWQDLGYDLDGVCTGHGDGDSCAEPSWASGDHTDGDDGRDNAIGAVASNLPIMGLFTQVFAAEKGEQSTIFRVREYDGSLNDSYVEVDIYSGTLWNSASDPSPTLPLGNEQDMWKVGDDWLMPPEVPGAPYDTAHSRYRATQAYVSDGVLVAYFESVLMGQPYLPAPPASGVIVTGKLIRNDDGRWVLQDGLFAGKWLTSDLVRLMSYYASTAVGIAPCVLSPQFDEVKSIFCPNVDIRVEKGADSSQPCDGMSMAFAFDAVPGSIGGHVESQLQMPTCPPENDPVLHGCSEQ
jgi:hypothetical protein